MKRLLIGLIAAIAALAQTPAPSSNAPTYFSTTGARLSYYDQTITETTNFGVRVTSAQSTGAATPQGFWAVMSIDATPRSKSSSAALRIGARYFLKSAANGNLIFHGNVEGGAVTSPVANSGTTASLLGNIQGGAGFVWRVCHTFNANAKVNCIVDVNYDLNAVSSQSVKPLLGLFVGLAF